MIRHLPAKLCYQLSEMPKLFPLFFQPFFALKILVSCKNTICWSEYRIIGESSECKNKLSLCLGLYIYGAWLRWTVPYEVKSLYGSFSAANENELSGDSSGNKADNLEKTKNFSIYPQIKWSDPHHFLSEY